MWRALAACACAEAVVNAGKSAGVSLSYFFVATSDSGGAEAAAPFTLSLARRAPVATDTL